MMRQTVALPPAPANDSPTRGRSIAALRYVERRGRAMRAWCERIRERGGVAITEERVDLPRLRRVWRELRDALGGAALR